MFALEAFCNLNGFDLLADDAAFIAVAVDIAVLDMSLDQIVGWLKANVGALVPDDFELLEDGQ
jgi:prophage maintenance system killer protein